MIDESTRSARVRVTLANPDGKLRPGMFVEAHMAESVGQPVIPIPASAVDEAYEYQ